MIEKFHNAASFILSYVVFLFLFLFSLREIELDSLNGDIVYCWVSDLIKEFYFKYDLYAAL